MPAGLEIFLAVFTVVAWVVLIGYGLWLATRFVRAVEKLADKLTGE